MDHTHVDYEMLQLKTAAETGDERAFRVVQKTIDWQRWSPEDFLRAIQLALQAGAHLAARQISVEGVAEYPEHGELQKYARILAPPKVTRSDEPPNPTLKTNRDWLKTHGDSFRGQWVALRNGQLLGSSGTLKSLVTKIGDTKDILLTRAF